VKTASLTRHAARWVSPSHRKWKRLLRSLTINPDWLTPPMAEPRAGDFIICGAPRSGTSLLAAVLYQPPEMITVMEPWDGMRLAPADLFASLREEIAQTGWLRRGRLDVGALSAKGEVRWGRDGEFPHSVSTARDYLLGVKWPAFHRYLPLLPQTKFLICLRHPVEVINSYSKQGGRLRAGLEYDIAFNRKMNTYVRGATGEDSLRRILLYDYVNLQLIPFLERPTVFVVRYERWFEDKENLLRELGEFLGTHLGPGKAVIRRPRPVDIPASELELIQRHCKSAAILGYDLNEPQPSISSPRVPR
jgi:hypothetical protein